MKKRIRFSAALLILALFASCLLSACAAPAQPADDGDPVVAAYGETLLRRSLVDAEKKQMQALSGGKAVSDKDAADQLLLNLIMLDEAKRRGLSVTQEQVDAEFEGQKKNYEEFPEVQQYIDDYCAQAGITLEEYYDAIRDQLPRVMLRQLLRDELGREYCQTHGLEFTKVNPPEKMTKYVQNYLDGLLDTYRKDITYYIDA